MEADSKKNKNEYKFICGDVEITKCLILFKLIHYKKFFVVKDNMIILNQMGIILYSRKQAIDMFLEEEQQKLLIFKNSKKVLRNLILCLKNAKIKYKRYNNNNSTINQKLEQSTLLIRKRVIKYD